ncbi:MAG: hypothetical protein ACOYN4_00730 [Bacteroidales bacterium]
MLVAIIAVYVLFGGISVFSNLGKWVFNSMILAIPFLPFMIIYFLIFGTSGKREEAIMMVKGIALAVLISGSIQLIIRAII